MTNDRARDATVPENQFSTTARRVQVLGKDGESRATKANPLPVDAVVSVDSMTINAEMKEASGHDYHVTTTNLGDGVLTVSFDSVSGLALADMISVENKTQGWIYSTKGATVTDTSILLVAANQEASYPVPGATDEFEIVYRADSRFTNAEQKTQIVDALGNVISEFGGADVDDTAFTNGTDKGTVVMGVVTSDSVDAGDKGALSMTAFRELIIAGFENVANSIRMSNVNPDSLNYITETLLDLTDIDENTTGYGYIEMNGFRTLAIQGVTSGATPTDVLTVTF